MLLHVAFIASMLAGVFTKAEHVQAHLPRHEQVDSPPVACDSEEETMGLSTLQTKTLAKKTKLPEEKQEKQLQHEHLSWRKIVGLLQGRQDPHLSRAVKNVQSRAGGDGSPGVWTGGCLTSAAVLQTPKGSKPIGNLSKEDSVNVFELAKIGEDGTISSQDLLGLAEGKVVGWATIDRSVTGEVLEMSYGNGGTLQLTKTHELMVKDGENGVKLKEAQQVNAGDYLAAVPVGGQTELSWRKVLSLRVVKGTGLYVPLVMSDAGPGDVLVLADGVLVPIYAEYGGLTPAQAHQVFGVWETQWQKLLSQHPCLDLVAPGHKASIAVEMLRLFSKHNPRKLMEEEMTPTLLICLVARVGILDELCPELAKSDSTCNEH